MYARAEFRYRRGDNARSLLLGNYIFKIILKNASKYPELSHYFKISFPYEEKNDTLIIYFKYDYFKDNEEIEHFPRAIELRNFNSLTPENIGKLLPILIALYVELDSDIYPTSPIVLDVELSVDDLIDLVSRMYRYMKKTDIDNEKLIDFINSKLRVYASKPSPETVEKYARKLEEIARKAVQRNLEILKHDYEIEDFDYDILYLKARALRKSRTHHSASHEQT